MQVTCSCGKSLRVDDSLAGKRIRCSGCQGVLTLPPLADVVPPREQIKSAPRAASPPPGRPRQEDEEPRPQRDRRFEDEEGDREERRPRRKRKRKAKAGSSAAAWVIIGVGTVGGVLLLTGLIVAVFFLGSRGGQGNPGGPRNAAVPVIPADVVHLQEFTSAEGRFKVLMPGAPQQRPSPQGGTIYGWEGEGCFFAVAVEDLPIPPDEPPGVIEKRLDGSRDTSVKKVNGKILSERRIQLQGKHPGREVVASLPDTGRVLRSRFYLVGSRAYLLTVIGEDRDIRSPTANRFFESLTLTN
jgi:hypothetical protein